MDLYLKAIDEAEMNAALLSAGLVYETTVQEQTGEDDNGDPIFSDVTVLVPVPTVSLDVIGPIVKWDYTVDPPIEIDYPEWHVNIRSYSLTETQLTELEPLIITPPEHPYRLWA